MKMCLIFFIYLFLLGFFLGGGGGYLIFCSLSNGLLLHVAFTEEPNFTRIKFNNFNRDTQLQCLYLKT